MSKVLIMVRVSTDRQDTEGQHNEMVEFCRCEGFNESDMIFVEDEGASAIKLDDKYENMIASVKDHIDKDNEISCFACWSLNRLARNERIFVEMKEFLVSHRVQMIIKNPYLKLLNPDGSVNKGMELAASLLSVLASQEMQEKKERFKRTKKANADKGKFNGGSVKFGYRKDENDFIVPDDKESEYVKTIFELYSTGNYSSYTLQNELEVRGITLRGKKITNHFLNRFLSDTTYIGRYDKGKIHRNSVPIISKELFEKVQNVKKEKAFFQRAGSEKYLAAGLVKCDVCGATYCSHGPYYSCSRHSHGSDNYCQNNIALHKKFVDSVLWYYASMAHADWLLEKNEDKAVKMEEELKLNDEKITNISSIIDRENDKKTKVVESYIDGLILKDKRDAMLASIDEKVKSYRDEVKRLTEQNNGIKRAIEKLSGERIGVDDILDITLGVYDERQFETMYEIIHSHISEVVLTRADIDGRKAYLFQIKGYASDRVEEIYYTAHSYNHEKYFKLVDGTIKPVPVEIISPV